jgi:thymidylate synthase
LLKIISIQARDLPDLWFQAVRGIIDHGRSFVIDQGSYAGQTRLEYDYFTGIITFPGTRPLLPDIPAHIGIPNPVDTNYLYGGEGYDRSYIEYLMTGRKEPGESYTYGSRLAEAEIGKIDTFKAKSGKFDHIYNQLSKELIQKEDLTNRYFINQIEWIIEVYKRYGHRNNQLVLQVAQPSDLILNDPPCLRSIDTRIQDGRLHFFVYFRSWDLWSAMPANLAAIQHLKEYMAGEIGVADGEMIVESKGLHIYGYATDLAKTRCML